LDQPAKTGNELKSATLNSHGKCLKVIDTFRNCCRARTMARYNNALFLSGLLGRYLAIGNAMDLLRRISSAAWQHLHFLGHYAFRDKRNPIDMEAILAEVILAF